MTKLLADLALTLAVLVVLLTVATAALAYYSPDDDD